MIIKKQAFFIVIPCLVIYAMYYNYHEDANYYTSINKSEYVYETSRIGRTYEYDYNDTEDFLINTMGCYIPNYAKNLVFKESRYFNRTCGERAIFIKRFGNYEIAFNINPKIMKKYTTKKYGCCFRFAMRSTISGKEDTTISYTKCEPFTNGTKVVLNEEVITVTCSNPVTTTTNEKERKTIVYEDAYILLKQIDRKKDKNKNWNVLLLGMDTMSRARFLSSMKTTAHYLKNNAWLDYKGYQKVGYNTFPNLMAALTGKKLSTIYKECGSGVHKCNNFFIWSNFREVGYVTAYGEDYLSLPDTFFKYKGFQTMPTHHYMRPFFLTGETHIGNLVCTKHKPSAKHLLDYAYEFANAYKDNKFFGTFWINSYSHNLQNIPTLLDKDVVYFFEQLNQSGVMNNTFVILFSDHGIRYDAMRVPMESYYEERLPMLFVWIPHEFRRLHTEKYDNLRLNQNRLVTPYDLYETLAEISNNSRGASDVETYACPQCTSLFEEKSENRSCADAGVSPKWCSCHGMTKSDISEPGAIISLQLAVSYIQNISKTIETIQCTTCSSLKLGKVLRIHSYEDSFFNRKHYVVAFQMTPSKVSFEAVVVKDVNAFRILERPETISVYNKHGNCVKNPNDRQYCVCRKTKCSHS